MLPPLAYTTGRRKKPDRFETHMRPLMNQLSPGLPFPIILSLARAPNLVSYDRIATMSKLGRRVSREGRGRYILAFILGWTGWMDIDRPKEQLCNYLFVNREPENLQNLKQPRSYPVPYDLSHFPGRRSFFLRCYHGT